MSKVMSHSDGVRQTAERGGCVRVRNSNTLRPRVLPPSMFCCFAATNCAPLFFIWRHQWLIIVVFSYIIHCSFIHCIASKGSEQLKRSKAEGQQLEEAVKINLGLLSLKQCMEALNRGASHIPYQSSMLTSILQGALGGTRVDIDDSSTSYFVNSRTLMGCTDPHKKGGWRTPPVFPRVR